MNDPEFHADGSPLEWADEPPIPPRYWWLKRITLAVGVVLFLIIALRLWWGWCAHHRLQTAIDKIIAAGEPIYPQDFDPPEPIPDDQNAAKLLLEAEKALTLTPDDRKLIESVLDDPAVLQERLDDIRKLIESNALALDLVHQARARSAIDWGIRVRSPAFTTMLPALSGQRTLGKLVSVAASYRRAIGDDSAAIGTLRDALAHARAIDAAPFVISHLVAIASYALVNLRVEELAQVLTPRQAADTARNGFSPTREQVRALIEELTDEKNVRGAFVRCMQCERMSQLDVFEALSHGEMGLSTVFSAGSGAIGTAPWERVLVCVLRPQLELDAMFAMRQMTKYVEAARTHNWPAAVPAFPNQARESTLLAMIARPVTSLWLPSLERAVVLHFYVVAERRMAGTALAIRLYEVDHEGRPEDLAKLLPDYLRVVPLDPFAADGRALGYRPDGTPPVLYSVGPNGIDDGGTYAFRPRGGINRDKLDIPFFLDGYRPQRPSDERTRRESTERRQHGEDIEGTRGNTDEDRQPKQQPR